MKVRRVITYFYNDLEQLISQVETTSEPVEQGLSEFEGDVGTQSLDHGEVPVGEGWRLFKVYEKKAIWIHHKEVSM